MNPLIPGVSDVLWACAVIVNTLLVIAALIGLRRATDKRGWLSAVLLVVFVPFVGPVVSLVTTRGRRVAQRPLSLSARGA